MSLETWCQSEVKQKSLKILKGSMMSRVYDYTEEGVEYHSMSMRQSNNVVEQKKKTHKKQRQ